MDSFEKILVKKRGFISKFPKNRKAVMIVSGGLDSITTCAVLMKDYNIELYPLHIKRGQTNHEAEFKSIQYYSDYFSRKFPSKFNPVKYIELNVPPLELKADLTEYTKMNGHPLRDTVLQMSAVQYGASLGMDVKTVFCAVVPEDYFPHSSLESMRATNLAVCQNMNDWDWLITSPNVDPNLFGKQFGKREEILWAHKNGLPIEETISCNIATKLTDFKNCGDCISCFRRKESFASAGINDKTDYHENTI